MAGIAAFGTLLKRGDGATAEAFTTVANITNITGPAIENAELNVSAHDSAGAYKEFVASGLNDPGTLDLEGNFDPSDTTHEQWLDDLDAADEHNYELVFPTDRDHVDVRRDRDEVQRGRALRGQTDVHRQPADHRGGDEAGLGIVNCQDLA
jgi:hypothetical protein